MSKRSQSPILYSDGSSINKEGGSQEDSGSNDDRKHESTLTKNSFVSSIVLPSGSGPREQLVKNGSKIMQNIPQKKKAREYIPGRINDLNPKKSDE